MLFTPYVYLIEDTIRNVSYVGSEYGYKSKTAHPTNLWNSYYTSSKLVKNHIVTYGLQSFNKIVILYSNSTDDPIKERIKDILQKESDYLIAIDARNNIKFLNQHNGDGRFYLMCHTEETKKKISYARVGMIFTEEHKNNISKNNYWNGKDGTNKNKKLSASHIENLKLNHVGMLGQTHTEETKKKISESHVGILHSEETKRKLSEMFSGSGNPNYGKHKTPEAKLKSKESNIQMANFRREFSTIHQIPYKKVTTKLPEFIKFVEEQREMLLK